MPLLFAHTVPPERVTWLWPGYLPFGKVAMLDGDPGLGKSCLLLDLGARLSSGRALPNGKQHPIAGSLFYMGEDGAADTIVPRLINAGADLTRIAIRTTYTNEATRQEEWPALPDDLGRLQEDIAQADAKLVVLDPIFSYLAPEINSNNDQQVRRALMPLAALAEETGAAIVLLRHLNKSQGGSALYRGGGSIGFVGVARSALLVARDPDDETLVVLASLKSNLGPPPPSLTFRLAGCDNGQPRIAWEGRSAHTAESLVKTQGDGENTAHSEAVIFLRELLGDHLPMLAREVWKQVNEAGHARNTILRAKNTLGVTVSKAHTQAGAWIWMLPHIVGDSLNSSDSSQQNPETSPLYASAGRRIPASETGDSSNSSDSSDSSLQNQKNLISLKSLKNPMPGIEDSSTDAAPPFMPPAARYPDVLVSGTYACANCALVQYMVEGGPQLCRACRAAAGHFARTAD